MNGGQNNPGTVRIEVTPNGSNPIQLSKQEVDKIVRCNKLEMIILNPMTGAVAGRGTYYPQTPFIGEENVTGTFEMFSIATASATGLTINKVILDTVTNKLSTASFTYAPKTAS
nr:MAG TPA: hypothetical protein [Caudoviricetes sp.]